MKKLKIVCVWILLLRSAGKVFAGKELSVGGAQNDLESLSRNSKSQELRAFRVHMRTLEILMR
jgi:hypothetical protein